MLRLRGALAARPGCTPGGPSRFGSVPGDGAAVVSPVHQGLKLDNRQILPLLPHDGQQFADTGHVGVVGRLRLIRRLCLSHEFLKHVHAPTIGAITLRRKAKRMRIIAIRVATGISLTHGMRSAMACAMRHRMGRLTFDGMLYGAAVD